MNAIENYRKINASSASPHRLIEMLFETFMLRLDQAVDGMKTGDIERKSIAINKAVAILGGLEEGLDLDKGGELASNLRELYAYSRTRLLAGSAEGSIEPLEEVKELLAKIQSAWNEIPDHTKETNEQ